MTNTGSPKSTKEHARISGNVVITTISLSGVVLNVSVSGQPVYVSGQPVTVSGQPVFVYISGGTITAATDISGQSVFTVPSHVVTQALATGSGVVNLTYTASSPERAVVDCITYHATSGTTTSSELKVTLQYGGTSSAFFTKLFSLNMAKDVVTDIYWIPQTEVWLVSGDAINMSFPNTDSCAYGAMIRVRQV